MKSSSSTPSTATVIPGLTPSLSSRPRGVTDLLRPRIRVSAQFENGNASVVTHMQFAGRRIEGRNLSERNLEAEVAAKDQLRGLE